MRSVISLDFYVLVCRAHNGIKKKFRCNYERVSMLLFRDCNNSTSRTLACFTKNKLVCGEPDCGLVLLQQVERA